MGTPEIVFAIQFGAVILAMVYQVVRKGGWKGAIFGARVRRKTGEIELSGPKMVRVRLKVYTLDPSKEETGPHVGLELTQSAIGSWSMQPLGMTRDEARRLAGELERAVRESEAGGGDDDF